MNRTIAVRRLAMAATLACQSLILLSVPAASAQVGPVPLEVAKAGYQSSTGRFFVSVTMVSNWYFESAGALFNGAAMFPVVPGSLITNNATRFGQGSFGTPLSYTDFDLGLAAPAGLAPNEFGFIYSGHFGPPEMNGLIGSVPPPGAPRVGPVAPGVAKVGYNPLTGDLAISSNVKSWRLESVAPLDDVAALFPSYGTISQPRIETTRDPHQLTARSFSDIDFDDNYLGRIAPTGLSLGNFTLHYKTSDNGPEILGEVVLLVPEPATITLLAVATIGLLRRRPRSANPVLPATNEA